MTAVPAIHHAVQVEAKAWCEECGYERIESVIGNDSPGPGTRGRAGLAMLSARHHAEKHGHIVWFERTVVRCYGPDGEVQG